MKYGWIGLVILLTALGAYPTTAEDPYAKVNASWERFGAVYSRIVDNYYANLDQEEIMGAAIEGMLGQLDSYSQYYDEKGVRQLRQDTTGKFAGLGITVAIKDRFPVVISPIEDTPAFRAGLQPGDLIVEVEGQSTLDMLLEEVVNTLRGEAGTKVVIKVVHRLGSPPRRIEIEREIIKIKSVVLVEELAGGVGYISMRQTRFSEHTSNEVEDAIKSLADAQGLILDLRGNPGGLLSQATQVADLFLPKGAVIVSVKEREGRRQEIRRSQRRPVSGKLPLVVLIDEGSASASEIVAGAIQDNDRGLIVGGTSFGKGSVQTIFDLHDIASSALKLTTALYYAPSGRSIHRDQSVDRLMQHVSFGDRELSPLLVMDLILQSRDPERALSALQAHFDMNPGAAQRILSTRLGDLAGRTGSDEKASALDSLADRTFHTQKGREVFGGGGIRPDISVESDPVPDYVRNLQRRRLFFDFVIDFVSADSTQLGAEPNVSDEMVAAFMDFVRSKDDNEDQQLAGRSQIEEISDIAEDMGWGDGVQASLQHLQASVEREWAHPFNSILEPHILKALHRELVLRFQGRKAQRLDDLLDDPQLAKAIEVISDRERYARALLKEGGE